MRRIQSPPSAPGIKVARSAPDPGEAGPLLAEADHRIANNLTMVVGLLRMHARHLARGEGPIDRDEVRQVLDDIVGRIQAVAQLHNLLAHAGGRPSLQLRDYLPAICELVTSSSTHDGKVELACEIEDGCSVAPDTALSLGLIFCELVTNSVKYAHPTGVPVAISIRGRHIDEGRLVFDYADDGIGLPEAFDPAVDGGIGFVIVRNRAEQLGADYRFESSDRGMRFHLSMPVGQSQVPSAA